MALRYCFDDYFFGEVQAMYFSKARRFLGNTVTALIISSNQDLSELMILEMIGKKE